MRLLPTPESPRKLLALAVVALAAGCAGVTPSPADDKLRPATSAGSAATRDADAPHVLRAARVYPSPDASPIDDALVVWRGHRIVAVGRRSEVAVPPDALSIPGCDGGTLVAGFQNSHVHFIGTPWGTESGNDPAAQARALVDTYTKWGFTTVVDLASDRDATLALRARIERGELPGPRILTASWPLFPAHGLPIYVQDLPRSLLDRMPQPQTPEAAARQVRENLDAGADATKLFIVTPQGRGQVKTMPLEIARAAVQASHARGAPVFVHPTSFAGALEALDAGADVLAHDAFDDGTPWPPELLHRAVAAHMVMVPTLKLLPSELAKEHVPTAVADPLVAGVVAHVHDFDAAGGTLMFGTDVGYMHDADPTDEYTLLARAGVAPMRILAMLTTTPAAFWHASDRRGRVAAGLDADLVVLDADPVADPANFAHVRCTLREGRPLYVGR
jgi:imidazolonepropionase-like amidohydrolase